MDYIQLLVAVISVCLGAGGAYVVLRYRKQGELQELHTAVAVLEERVGARQREVAACHQQLSEAAGENRQGRQSLANAMARITELETRLTEERQKSQEKLQLLDEAKQQLQREFQNLAQQIFDEKSRRFAEQNRDHLDQLLAPFRLQLKDFEKKVDETYQKEARERFSLRQEVLRLQDLNQQIQADAVNLTRALKGEAKTQGCWGEVVLERILELSGLHKGREYETQGSFRDPQGKHLRPDVVIHLPEQKDVIVDSKVSLTAYERYVNADDDSQRAQALRQHLTSLHGHLKDLQSKRYQDLSGLQSLDFVLMFVPVEGAFFLAMEEDSQLFQRAFEHNIVIVSPSTLLVTLRTIRNIWRYEYQNRNALEIARQAGNLYDHFVRFVGDLEKIGELLDRTRQSYEQAHKRLATGRGNLVRRAEGLRQLGISNSRTLPDGMTQQAEEVTGAP